MSVIQVPIDTNLDTTDFYDPGVICGSLPPEGLAATASCNDEGNPSGAPKECTANGNSFKGEHNCKHAWVSKKWQVKLEMGADWDPGEGFPKRWKATNHTTYFHLFPTQGESADSDFGKDLRSHIDMTVSDSTCFSLTETQTSTTHGLTAGGSAEPEKTSGSLQYSVAFNVTKGQRAKCNDFKYKPIDVVANPKVYRVKARNEGACEIDSCYIKGYKRSVTGSLVFKKGMKSTPITDNLEVDIQCEYRRVGDSSLVKAVCVDGCDRSSTRVPFPNT
jgi:hypothetical protein